MRSLTETCIEDRRPKQYCTFVGSRSMLQHTLDRMASIVLPEQVITVIGLGHREFLTEPGAQAIPGSIIEQPLNLGTAPGILLPTAYVIDKDPQATIVVLPSDHFVHPERKFLENVVQASKFAEQHPDRLILIGATPDRPEIDFGWIVAEDAVELPRAGASDFPLLRVTSFREKPDLDEARSLFRRDALWNTMVIAVKAETLWALARQCLPAMMDCFDAFRQILRAVRKKEVEPGYETRALADLYQKLTPADFSKDVLEHITGQISVMPMAGVTWCDWGRPQRVTDSLALLLQKQPFLVRIGERRSRIRRHSIRLGKRPV